jgi:YD repeat-containing protein
VKQNSYKYPGDCMRNYVAAAFLLFSSVISSVHGQMPAPAVPDNTLNATNTIGLPSASSKDGDSEVVNLNNGALNLFLPIVTLPQRAGSQPLKLGFTYDSNQMNLQMTRSVAPAESWDHVNECSNWCPYIVDYITINEQIVQIAGVFSAPLDVNIPQLSASLEYDGDWTFYTDMFGFDSTAARYCVTNIVFRDWQGTAHAFSPLKPIACDAESATRQKPTLAVTLNSNDNEFYHLDVSNRADFVVYAPDGTAYHFANPHLPCGTTKGGLCPQGETAEQYINMPMSSSVDKVGNTMTFNRISGVLTDTLGRNIQISGSTGTGMIAVSYTDTSGQAQSVSLQELSSADSTIPQATGNDVGPDLKYDLCQLTGTSNGYPPTPVYTFNDATGVDNWSAPVHNSSRVFNGIGVHYSSTGQTYKLLFDSYGHLARIAYPEGGYHRYDYSGYNVQFDQGDAMCQWTMAEVAHRYECTNSSGTCSTGDESVTIYTPSINGTAIKSDPCDSTSHGPGGGMTLNSEMAVVDPDGTTSLHCFSTAVLATSQLTNYETDKYVYSAKGMLLQRTHRDYGTSASSTYPFPTKVTTTAYDGNSPIASTIQYQYDIVPAAFAQVSDEAGGIVSREDAERRVGNPVQTDIYGYDGAGIKSISQSWYYFGANAHAPLSTKITDSQTGQWHTTVLDYQNTNCVYHYTDSGSGANTSTWTYTPDTWCRPTSIQDPNNQTTTYGYSDLENGWSDGTCAPASDSHSYLTSITNPLQQKTNFKYYSCTGQLGQIVDPNGTAVMFTYDGAQRITQRQVQNGSVLADQINVAYADGPGGSITHTVKSSPSPDVIKTFSLDGLGRVYDVSTLSDPYGATHVTTYFDPVGQVQAVTNPYRTAVGGITSYLYDSLKRKTYQCQPDDNGRNTINCAHGSSFLQWTYSGNVVTSQDERGNRWQRTMDALNRLTNVKELGSAANPLNTTTNYSYDAFDNLLSVQQLGQGMDTARGLRKFSYDGRSHLITSFNPESGTICYGIMNSGNCNRQYDGNGNLLNKTDARGVQTNYSYDNLNRLLSKTYTAAPAGSMSSCYQFDTAINGVGKLAFEWTQSANCPTSAQSSPPASGYQSLHIFGAYDPMGRVVAEQQCVAGYCTSPSVPSLPAANCSALTAASGLQYCYDQAGNLLAYSSGLTTAAVGNYPQAAMNFSQTFDAANRLLTTHSSMVDSTHPATLFTTQGYTAANALSNWQLGASLFTVRNYDIRQRVCSQLSAAGQSPTATQCGQ